MYWDRITLDELAEFQRGQGLRLQRLDGIWWVEIRPFFFRPLFPFTEVLPGSSTYPKKAFVGGYLHAVPSGAEANSCINLYVYDNLQSYSINSLSSKRRTLVKNSMKHFTAKRITDIEEFIDGAYNVYLSFQSRTNYSYKNDRVNRQGFIRWAESLFRYPKVQKLGAYLGDKLTAVEISYLVDDIIVGDTLFAEDAALGLNVTDFIYHRLREAAAQTKARYFFVGLPTGVESLDRSKLYRGCKVLPLPACYCINPVTLQVIKIFMRSSYQKLQKIITPPFQAEPAEGEFVASVSGPDPL